MPRSPRRTRIAPGFYLEEITVTVPITGFPIVKLSGRAKTGNPRIDAVSSVTVITTALPPSGERFIEEMQAQFAGAQPATVGRNKPKA